MADEEEVSALAMEEESNPAEVIESETPPPEDQAMENFEENGNINDENINNFAEDSNAAPDAENEDREKLDFGDSSDSDEDEVVVTIGDIKTNLPPQRRGFPVQKLDPNVTPNVQGKNIFDVNPSEFDDRPWLKSGANIADYFNFGFTEETWNEYAEKQRLLRLEYPSQAEVNRTIMDELRDKHGNKDAGVPIVMPVHNSGGRNLVTIQSVDTKPPVKIGFPTQNNIPINTSAAENLPPMIRHLVSGLTNSPQPQQQQQTVQIPTVNLTTPVVGTLPTTPTKPIVVDLTRPPPNFNPNIPPPHFNASKPATDSPTLDLNKPDLPPGVIPTTTSTSSSTSIGFNPNIPPPNFPIRLPATNLTNLSRPMNNPMGFNRPPMGNYYNPMAAGGGMMGSSMNLNGPPPSMLRHNNSNDGPPGISSSASRPSMDGPPGTEIDNMYRSERRERDRDTRRRDSDGSDDDRRRRRHDRGDRERDRDSRDTRTRRRSRSPRERSSRHDRDSRNERDRDERSSKRRTSRDRDEPRSSSRRYKEEEREASTSSSSRRHRRDKDDSKPSKSSSSTVAADLDDRPPGV